MTSLLHGRCRKVNALTAAGPRVGDLTLARTVSQVSAGGEAPHALQGKLAGFFQPAFLQQAEASVQQRGYGYGSASFVRDDPP